MRKRNRRRTQNDIRISGNETFILLKKRTGETVETIINTEDYEKIKHIHWYKAGDYVRGFITSGDSGYSLHRMLMGDPKGYFIDHINHNTLDNRKENLRVVTTGQNTQNMKGAMKNNKSCGIRGVTWCKSNSKWMARITVNKKRFTVGFFDNLEDAEVAVKHARATLMPYSYEAYTNDQVS